jgi:hypothetical protein
MIRSIRNLPAASCALAILAVVWIAPVAAGDPPAFAARDGLAAAGAAARSWARDAYLVYLENDEPADGAGRAVRWGYLYYSPGLDGARAYSVRNGRIAQAGDFPLRFEAPPIPAEWIDSHEVLEAAGVEIAARIEKEIPGATLSRMLLMRGAFDDERPDGTTWVLVYESPAAPSLFVVVDAATGRVARTWRG